MPAAADLADAEALYDLFSLVTSQPDPRLPRRRVGYGPPVKYALFICVEEDVEPVQSESVPEAVEAWAAEMAERGVRLGGWPLGSTADATTIRVRGGDVQRLDGSFADPTKRIAGFNILECESAEEAFEVARRHPVAAFGTVEIRQMIE